MGERAGRLPAPLQRRLQQAGALELETAVAMAERGGIDLYLVGGAVRDLLLGEEQLDVDLVTEGDVFRLAKAIGAKLDARVVCHERFGTAVVQRDGLRLDLARARSERYTRPGALPTVYPASMTADLRRRDFTINAMAVLLAGRNRGALLDPFGGREDLRRRRIRVLHDGSFRDDATRILRALRYAARLGFRLESETGTLLERDRSYLHTISGARLRNELARVAAEQQPAAVVRSLTRYGVLAAVHPALRADAREIAALRRLKSVPVSHRVAVFISILLANATRVRAQQAIDLLALSQRQAAAVRGILALRRIAHRLASQSLRPSSAVALFAPHPIEAIEAFSLWARPTLAAKRARVYLDEWRFVRPRLNGRDLQALGVQRGPRIGAALSALLKARLDGGTRTRDDEIALVRRMMARKVRGG